MSQNSYLLLLLISMVTDSQFAFEIARKNISIVCDKYEILADLDLMKSRTDHVMRKLLEFCLQAAIITGEDARAEMVLLHARKNTMLCQVTHDTVQTALRRLL